MISGTHENPSDDLRSNNVNNSCYNDDLRSGPGKWRWTNANMTLVFMGDYVAKGLTARQTVEFVRDLTITFPNGVATILGNHELHHKPSYGNSNKFGDQMT